MTLRLCNNGHFGVIESGEGEEGLEGVEGVDGCKMIEIWKKIPIATIQFF